MALHRTDITGIDRAGQQPIGGDLVDALIPPGSGGLVLMYGQSTSGSAWSKASERTFWRHIVDAMTLIGRNAVTCTCTATLRHGGRQLEKKKKRRKKKEIGLGSSGRPVITDRLNDGSRPLVYTHTARDRGRRVRRPRVDLRSPGGHRRVF